MEGVILGVYKDRDGDWVRVGNDKHNGYQATFNDLMDKGIMDKYSPWDSVASRTGSTLIVPEEML